MSGLRVVLADDHARVRASVRRALEEGGHVVVAEAASGPAAVEAALAARPDVVLLDIHMPGSGIRAAGTLAEALPGTPVVMLTYSRDDDDLFDALRVGACGYLTKDLNPAELPTALSQVVAGESVLSPGLLGRVLDRFRATPSRGLRRRRDPRLQRLSSREWEVLTLLRQGLSTAQVAEQLFVSPTTVRVHVSAALRKLQVADRAEAMRLLDES